MHSIGRLQDTRALLEAAFEGDEDLVLKFLKKGQVKGHQVKGRLLGPGERPVLILPKWMMLEHCQIVV